MDHEEQPAEVKQPVFAPTVIVYLIEERPDGTFGIGNSHECPKSEAVAMIEQGHAKAPEEPIGVVPKEWK